MLDLLMKLEFKRDACMRYLCPFTLQDHPLFGLAALVFLLGSLGVAGTPTGGESQMPEFVIAAVSALFKLGLGITATIFLAPVGIALL